LAEKPVGFCCPISSLAKYQQKAEKAGAGSMNGLVSLALAEHLGA
jgi:hypothetical protein